jgi:hypothetical protein
LRADTAEVFITSSVHKVFISWSLVEACIVEGLGFRRKLNQAETKNKGAESKGF